MVPSTLASPSHVSVFAVLIALLGAGCVDAKDREPVAREAGAKDLACPGASLDVRSAGNRLFYVSGCGKVAVYRIICKLTAGSCYALKQ
ncbi:MAG: hypothetical protein U0235_10040 [Polyangiaceae bacterium]